MKKSHRAAFIGLFCLTLISIIYLGFDTGRQLCLVLTPGRDGFGHFSLKNPEATDKSYLLFSAFTQSQFLREPGNVYLTDLHGRILHSWQTKYQTLYASLEKNGNIITAMINPGDLSANPGGGGTGLVEELDWEGNVVWRYENPMIHHDFERLPNGNTAFLAWDKIPDQQVKKIIGGKPENSGSSLWADAIIEVDQEGNEIWSWHAAEHLAPEKYPLGSDTPRREWTHANSVRFYEQNPITGRPVYLVSFRNINRLFMIDRETSDIVWESRPDILAYQHDATLLPNGRILAFDNGLLREQTSPIPYSRIVEIDPREQSVAWQFDGGKAYIDKARFFSSIMSGAQRLGNGNTFFVNALQGRMTEISSSGQVVWDMVNPYFAPKLGAWENNVVFKARRYGADEIDWPEKLPGVMSDMALRFCRN